MIGPMQLSRVKLFCSSLLQDAFLVAVLLALPVERIVAEAGADQSSDSGWPRNRSAAALAALVVVNPVGFAAADDDEN